MPDTTLLRRIYRSVAYSFTGITTDQILTFTAEGGQLASLFDIADVDWDRIVIDVDVTTITGTNVIFKLKTANARSGTAIAATTMDAKNGAGTAIVSSTITAAGREMITVARLDSDSGASTIGRMLGLYADVTSLSALVGTANIYVGK
jgi:hypothetical protein